VSGFVKIEPPLLKRSDFSLFLKNDTDSQGKERKRGYVLTSKTKEKWNYFSTHETTSNNSRERGEPGSYKGSGSAQSQEVTEERAESGLVTRSRVCGGEIVTGGEYSRGDKTLENKWERLAARGNENGPLVRERERETRGSAKRKGKREKNGAETE
jgi:hypothetical protein